MFDIFRVSLVTCCKEIIWQNFLLFDISFCFKLVFIGVQLLYIVVSASAVQQNESAIHTYRQTYIHTYIHTYPFSLELLSHSGHHSTLSRVLLQCSHQLSKWQPTPVFLPGESQGWGSMVGCHLWGRTESDTTEATQQQHLDIIRKSGLFNATYITYKNFTISHILGLHKHFSSYNFALILILFKRSQAGLPW